MRASPMDAVTLQPDGLAATCSPADGEAAIHFQGVGVRYRLPQERIRSFKEYAIRRLQGKVNYRDFWALQGVSFTVRRGDAVAVIGRNGAGKSTLLKVVARVLRP